MSAFWSGHVGVAAGCHCRVLLEGAAVRGWCVRFRAGMLVPLQGTAAGCCLRAVVRAGVCAFAAAGSCCRVPLQGVALSLLLEGAARKVAGAAAGVPAARCCRQSAGSASGRRCFGVPTDFLLSGVSAGGIFQRISLALMKWGKGSCVQAT